MTEFARAARRPHWPREVAMRELFAVAGIENPNAGGDGAPILPSFKGKRIWVHDGSCILVLP